MNENQLSYMYHSNSDGNNTYTQVYQKYQDNENIDEKVYAKKQNEKNKNELLMKSKNRNEWDVLQKKNKNIKQFKKPYKKVSFLDNSLNNKNVKTITNSTNTTTLHNIKNDKLMKIINSKFRDIKVNRVFDDPFFEY